MYEIHTLKVGELFLPQGGSVIRDPIHCWLVTDGKSHALVDSGMPDVAEVNRRLKVDGEGGGHGALRKSLSELGVDPEQIDYVLLTHLHFDHAWNLDLFPTACVVVQRDEAVHAMDPAATQRIYYFRETLLDILQRKRPKYFQFVDGDVEILPGIELMKTPGHTPGMQVPIVQTEKGRAALVSDLGDHYKYWFPDDPRATDNPMRFLAGSYLPSPIRSESERDFVASMRRVREASDIVVPAHDFRIPRHMPSQWFEIPESTEGDLSNIQSGKAAE